VTTILDTLIETTLQARLEQETAAEAAKAREDAHKMDGATEDLRLALVEALGVELYDTLALGYRAWMQGNTAYAEATYTDGEARVRYKISIAERLSPKGQLQFSINPGEIEKVDFQFSRSYYEKSFPVDAFRTAFLLLLAVHRHDAAEQDKKRREHAEQKAEAVLRDARLQRQREQEKAVQQRERLDTHERLAAIVENTRQELLAAAWLWPLGTTLTLYRITWASAAVSDEAGEGLTAQFAEGWTLTDTLDPAGYIHLEARQYGHPGDVKLMPAYHKPVFERHIISAFEDVPYELRVGPDKRALRTIRRETVDGQSLYVETAPGYRGFDEYVTVSSGILQPVPWVRELVDKLAGREPQPPMVDEADGED
jgi:hypothetical protein